MPELTPCRDCGVPVWFLRHVTTGSLNPIEPTPAANGNIVLVGEDSYRQLKGGLFDEGAPEGAPRYLSHFVNCPKSKDWRKKKGAKRA